MKYEFMGILKPFLPEDVRGKLQQGIERVLKSKCGNIMTSDIWGKRHFSYKMKGHEEGYYILYQLEIPKEHLQEIQTELRLISDLLRFVIIGREK